MPKTSFFQVKEGRIFFKCPHCKHRRMMAMGAGPRRRSVRCQKCGEKSICVLDRRQMNRESQEGRVILLVGGRQVEVTLLNISTRGVGFELDMRSGIKIEVGKDIELRCGWNPQLFKHGRYVVRSVRGQKIGAECRA